MMNEYNLDVEFLWIPREGMLSHKILVQTIMTDYKLSFPSDSNSKKIVMPMILLTMHAKNFPAIFNNTTTAAVKLTFRKFKIIPCMQSMR